MTSAPSLLVFGRDPLLLQTRRWLLESQGFSVKTAEKLEEVRVALEEGRVDLLVLCHSATQDDAAEAAALLEERYPESKLLALTANRAFYPIPQGGESVQVLDGPKSFIDKVQQLLQGTATTSPAGDGDRWDGWRWPLRRD